MRVGAGTVIGPHVVLTGRTTPRRAQPPVPVHVDRRDPAGPQVRRRADDDDDRRRQCLSRVHDLNAGTAQDRGDTRIGNGNLFLAYTHVAHDCVVGNWTMFSNNAQLAGHVHIGDWVVMGAYSGVHQFCRVGAHAMIAAGAIVLQDVPPFVTASGYPATPRGINTEGLRRRGFTAEEILAVRRAYKTLYREGRDVDDAGPRWSPPPRRRRHWLHWSIFLPCPAAASSAERRRHRAMDDAVSRSGRVTIGIVAGEASGDALAATLIHAVRARMPHARFVGVAGPRMEAAGCEAWYPLETLAVRGFVEVLSRLPQLFALRRALFQRLVAERVPVFVGVDAPDFNLGLEARLKRAGVRTLHFVSPSVWAWRRERVHRIGRSVHRMLALFPFEPPIYEAAGVPVTFVGHPLAAHAAVLGSRRLAREQLKLGIAQPVFALLPGSRASELDMHGDLVLHTAATLHAARPDARFLVPLATRPTRDRSSPPSTGSGSRNCR